MKKKETENDLMIDFMKGLKTLPNYDLELENGIMEMVDQAVDHSINISKYQKRSLIGYRISIVLVLALFGISFNNLIQISQIEKQEIGLDFFLPSLFALLGLCLLFLQHEIRRNFNQKSYRI